MPAGDWKKVRAVLRKLVFPKMSSEERGEAWLAALERVGNGGLLLAASMTIDVLNGTIDAEDLARFFDRFKPGDDPLATLETMPYDDMPPRKQPNSKVQFDGGGCVRIVEVASFISGYLGRTVNAASVAYVRNEYLRHRRLKPLGEVQNARPGRKGVTWILPRVEYEAAAKANPDTVAGFLNDALGLGFERGKGENDQPEFVALFYPLSFEHHAPARQPTSFDASWEPYGFYVSWVNDNGWGRTQSCSGQDFFCHERVHTSVKALSDEYMLLPLGIASVPSKDESRLLEAACVRLKKAARDAGFR